MLVKGFQAFAVAILACSVGAIDLKINDEESLKNAAATAAFNAMSNYTGNMTGHVPGSIAHNWWVGGSLFQTMIQYWYFTEDASNNAAVSQGMYWQRGDNDFSPSNFSAYMSNDDQMSWGLAAMTAAELGYPQDSGMPSWLTLAEGVFNAQVPRWDTKTCDGGLRWQIRPYQAGYTIKNAISNGGLFQLSARLAHYTKNQTYFEWAEKIWDWSASSAILDTQTWSIADSIHAQQGCESPGNMQWTYNYGPYINGAAYMYNVTKGQPSKWKSGLDGLLNTTLVQFFPASYGGSIMVEVTCEPTDLCNANEQMFKGLLASNLAFVTRLAPYTASTIIPKLRASAVGAAKQCTGGNNRTLCGQHWYKSEWDGTANLEEQISATSIFTSNIVAFKDTTLATNTTPASSQTSSSTETQAAIPSSTGKLNEGSTAFKSPFSATLAVIVLAQLLTWYSL